MENNYKLTEDDSYMLVAMRRKSPNKNENMDYDKIVLRKFVSGKMESDYMIAAKRFSDSLSHELGFWRMYRSVNKRDIVKALKALQIKIIEHGETFAHKVDSEWKSILMQHENKAERLFLVDIDTIDDVVYKTVIATLVENNVSLVEQNKTPNGIHIVTKPFNPKLIEKIPSVELKRDALYFLYSFGDSTD